MTTVTLGPQLVPALSIRDLAVGYRVRRDVRAVLERLNVSIEPGELVSLLGPNGIGKSTLLRTVARMQAPLWGEIDVAGTDLKRMTAMEMARHVGVVLTERLLVDALPVRRVVELGRYPHSGWFGGVDARGRDVVDWAIDAVGVRHLADRDVSRLSDGERQRVMIARALAQEPSLLVLDEPTAYLDVPSRVELMGLLRRLTRDGRLAVLVSTHDLELALRTSDAVWLLMPGGELKAGTPEDVVMSGAIAEAFEGRQIRFHAEERTFRLRTGHRGMATVRGTGLRAAMAKAVLEREGYALAPDGPASACDLTVDTGEVGWCASGVLGASQGRDFASLAAFVRERSATV